MSCRQEEDYPVVAKEVILADLLEVLQDLSVDDLLVVWEELLASLEDSESDLDTSV